MDGGKVATRGLIPTRTASARTDLAQAVRALGDCQASCVSVPGDPEMITPSARRLSR